MQIKVQSGNIAQFEADALIVNLFEGVQKPGGGTGAVDKAMKDLITEELAFTKAFKGKLGETLILQTAKALPARYVIVVGLGKQDKLGPVELRRASAAAIRTCMKLKIKTVGTLLHGAGIGGVEPQQATRLLTEGALLGSYQFTKHKNTRKPKKASDSEETTALTIKTLTILEQDPDKLSAIEAGLHQGKAIAENVNLARDWVFDSANHITPSFLVEQAKIIPGLTCHVLDFKAMAKLGMGAFTLVAQGSDAPSYLIHLTYKPKGKAKKKVALVGKGITFDSGGLSLKPPGSMELMKMDMAGAAAILATLRAISQLKDLDIEVHGFIPTCENMPSGRSSKPGDIAKTLNGKTVEVNNTDAEGRLILCDALTYAQQEVKPDEIIDLATLTGACVVALGKAASGVMGTSQELIEGIRTAGDKAGEKYWQLPLYDEYKDALKSDVADLINAGSKGEAGTSCAGMFLKEFIEDDRAWAHLDIAGPAWTSKDQPEVPKGATGVGVRTLLYYLYQL